MTSKHQSVVVYMQSNQSKSEMPINVLQLEAVRISYHTVADLTL